MFSTCDFEVTLTQKTRIFSNTILKPFFIKPCLSQLDRRKLSNLGRHVDAPKIDKADLDHSLYGLQ